MELPLEAVRAARKGEMDYAKGKLFKVVKKAEAFKNTAQALGCLFVHVHIALSVKTSVLRARLCLSAASPTRANRSAT